MDEENGKTLLQRLNSLDASWKLFFTGTILLFIGFSLLGGLAAGLVTVGVTLCLAAAAAAARF